MILIVTYYKQIRIEKKWGKRKDEIPKQKFR